MRPSIIIVRLKPLHYSIIPFCSQERMDALARREGCRSASPFIGAIIMVGRACPASRRAPEYARFLSDARGAIYPRFRCTLCIRVYIYIGMSIFARRFASLSITIRREGGGGGGVGGRGSYSPPFTTVEQRTDAIDMSIVCLSVCLIVAPRRSSHHHFANIS